MKKLLIVCLVALLAVSIFADMQQNDGSKRAIGTPSWVLKTKAVDRVLPAEVTIAYAPVQLMFSYQDYMHGSYSSIPMRMQNNGAGIYMIYHGQ